jgi:uncharacterized repeat protein (TIGR03803 family)
MIRSHLLPGLHVRGLTPLLVALLFLAGSALAAQETVILHFNKTNGWEPLSGPVADEAGNLYGTTFGGGKDDCGTVYRLSVPPEVGGAWTRTAFYSFHCGTDGAEPYGGLIFDKRGNLYGTTTLGGSGSCLAGCGTVFELVRPTEKGGKWTKSILYTFQGGTTDGSYPEASLVFDTQGNLYGTSEFGGGSECAGHGCGTVFELSPPQQKDGAWSEAVLHIFIGPTSTDAYAPMSNLIFDSAGNLYGTTIAGGSYNNGAVFELSPPAAKGEAWTEAVIYSFIGPPDGSSPMAGLVLAPSGVFYGTASGSGPASAGTVFELAPPARQGGAWTETVLHSFAYSPGDGSVPFASVVLDAAGNLYGTTLIGGDYSCDPGVFIYGCGVAYKLAPPAVEGEQWTETILHNFSGGDGIQPLGGLTFGKFGWLYGTTDQGGPSDAGTVFSVAR